MSSSTFPLYVRIPNQALIGALSIAIWNKNKVVMSMAIGTWGINVALLIQGKYLLLRSLFVYMDS